MESHDAACSRARSKRSPRIASKLSSADRKCIFPANRFIYSFSGRCTPPANRFESCPWQNSRSRLSFLSPLCGSFPVTSWVFNCSAAFRHVFHGGNGGGMVARWHRPRTLSYVRVLANCRAELPANCPVLASYSSQLLVAVLLTHAPVNAERKITCTVASRRNTRRVVKLRTREIFIHAGSIIRQLTWRAD